MDVFLSYAKEDKDIAFRLVRDLAIFDVSVSLDAVEMTPRDTWVDKLKEQIQSCPNFVALVAKRSRKDLSATTELAIALSSDGETDQRRIIPLIIDKGADVPPFLGQFQAIDISSTELYREGLITLVSRLVKPSRLHKISTTIDIAEKSRAFEDRSDAIRLFMQREVAVMRADTENEIYRQLTLAFTTAMIFLIIAVVAFLFYKLQYKEYIDFFLIGSFGASASIALNRIFAHYFPSLLKGRRGD